MWLSVLLPALVAAGAVSCVTPGEVLLQALSRPFAPVQPEQEISVQCREDSQLYLQELANFTSWAFHMYDASSKLPSGVITGNIQQLGNFDQCLQISVSNNSSTNFQGQLCSAVVQFAVGGFPTQGPPQEPASDATPGLAVFITAVATAAGLDGWKGPVSAPYQWSFCVPSTCSAADVEAALNYALLPLNAPGVAEVAVSVDPEHCLVATAGPRLGAKDYSFITFLILIAVLALFSTWYDLTDDTSPSDWTKKDIALKSFSLYTNSSQLTKVKQDENTLCCLDGIRFLSIVWIIFGHTYYQKSVGPLINSITVKYMHEDWSKMLVMNGTISTDTFFLVSGVLLANSFMRDRQKGVPFNLLIFYLQRYIRLTPLYAAVVFFYATLFEFTGSGPLWGTWVVTNCDNCMANWWTNLLYINNFVNVSRMCLSQSWYLAVNMQFLLVSPFLLVPLWKWERYGRWLLGVSMGVALFVPFLITVLHRLAAAMLYTRDTVTAVYLEVYIPVYTRAGPYIIGLALGYYLFMNKGKKLNLNRVQVTTGWLLAAISSSAVLFGVYGLYKPEHKYSVVEAGVYAGVHRSVWAVAVAWMVFACVNGYAGPVNTLLSWPPFQPLNRLTYGAYLIHFSVLLYGVGSSRTPSYLSDYNVVHEFLGNLVLSLALSFALSVLLEMPFIALGRAFLAQEPVPVENVSLVTVAVVSPKRHSLAETMSTSAVGVDNNSFHMAGEESVLGVSEDTTLSHSSPETNTKIVPLFGI